MKDIFTQIYTNNSWGSKESVSGPGSTLKETQHLRRELEHMLRRLEIRSVVDAPCGDFNWMSHINLEGISYLGCDIVVDLCQKNARKFPQFNFIELDITKHFVPPTDLIICRDCLFHLSFDDIFRAIDNFRQSGSIYLLATSHTWKSFQNNDVQSGRYRRLNLELSPFLFPPPLEIIVEGNSELNGLEVDRSMCLWRIDSLPGMRLSEGSKV